MGLRASKQATTKKSPYEIVFGKTMTLPLDVAFLLPNSTSFERIEKNVLDEQIKKNKERTYQRHRKNNHFFTKNTVPLRRGAKVMVKTRMGEKEKYEGPYLIVECITEWKYLLENLITKQTKIRNFNQLKVLKK